jgi:hypothetical protein
MDSLTYDLRRRQLRQQGLSVAQPDLAAPEHESDLKYIFETEIYRPEWARQVEDSHELPFVPPPLTCYPYP